MRRFFSPPDKLAFVGFKGSFRPDWVRMSVDEERAKLHQVLPIPVIKMMKLWRRAAHSRTSQTHSSTTASFTRTTEPKPPIRTEHVFMLHSNITPPSRFHYMWQRGFDNVIFGLCRRLIILDFQREKKQEKKEKKLKTNSTFLVFDPLGDVCLHVTMYVFSKYVEKDVSDSKCCGVSSF